MSNSLFLYSEEFQQSAPAVAGETNVDFKQAQRAETWEDIAKAIGRHRKLDKLVLYYHGFQGGIIVDDGGFSLSDEEVAKHFAKTNSQVSHILFEGCWVGEEPNEMAAFGRLFKADRVSGFTWASHWASGKFTIPKGSTVADLRKAYEKYEPWFAPGTPPLKRLALQASKRQITITILMHWYSPADFEKKPPYENNNFERNKRQYKVRSEAGKRTVKAKDAKRSTAPVSPFEHVTVVLD